MRPLVIGAQGMLGHTLFRELSKDLETWGTVRGRSPHEQIYGHIQHDNLSEISALIDREKITHVVNCVGIIKQLEAAKDHRVSIEVNALFPHQLSELCEEKNIKLIHFSTDCVFDGTEGGYREYDEITAKDLYGKTKAMGEVDYSKNAVTLRTSIVGHELKSSKSLLCWFLAQEGGVQGFEGATFSGVTTDEMANILKNYVLPHKDLCGLFHVSGPSINKFKLLHIVKEVYGKTINISPVQEPRIDRTLNDDKFKDRTGYAAKEWPIMIQEMYINQKK
jgi:dTDP-4-dehydrorhamnose reductase